MGTVTKARDCVDRNAQDPGFRLPTATPKALCLGEGRAHEFLQLHNITTYPERCNLPKMLVASLGKQHVQGRE